MDYVYICRSGDNDELKYSLRSIEENMPEGRVWVVGHRPIWYIGDFIPVDDIGGKFDNIRNCIKTVSEHSEISDDFFQFLPKSIKSCQSRLNFAKSCHTVELKCPNHNLQFFRSVSSRKQLYTNQGVIQSTHLVSRSGILTHHLFIMRILPKPLNLILLLKQY